MQGRSNRVIPIIYMPMMLACVVVVLLFNPFVAARFFSDDGMLSATTSMLFSGFAAAAALVLVAYSYLLLLWRRGGSELPGTVADWTISVLVVVVVFGFAEVTFRLFFDDHLKRDIYAYNPYFGMNYSRPNLDERLATSEYDAAFRTNSIGLRDDRELTDKRTDEVRAVIMGDSFVQGVQVLFEETTAYRLEQQLRQSGLQKSPTVINVSRSGWTSDNEREFLGRNIALFEPDVVVVVSYVGNDIIELMLRNRLRQHQGDESLGKKLALLATNRRNPSQLVRFLGEQLAGKVEWPMGRPNQPFFSRGLGGDAGNVFKTQYSEEIESAYEDFLGDIVGMRRIAESYGAQFLLALAPTKEQVHAEDLAEVVEFMDLDTGMLDMDKPQRIISEFAAANGIAVVDLLEQMRRAGTGKRLYFPINSHWNAAGHRVAEEVLAPHVLEALRAKQAG